MDLLGSAWDWVAIKENREKLAFIGGGLAAAIAAAWAVYLHFFEKPKTITASAGGIAAGRNVSPTASSGGIAVVSTAPVTIGITLAEHKAELNGREQEIRAELAQANAADKALLERQLSDIQAKLANSEAALEDRKRRLAQASQALDDFKKELLPEPLERARLALQKGETSDAEALFRKVLSGGKEKAAEAAYQLGQLAEG
ncbi:MAG: hypothetical protein ACREDT_07225, partial [Methylocella sp.]